MGEEYELNQEELKVLHSGLIKSDRVDETYIGSQDEFIAFINNDPKNLLKFRTNLIEDGKFSSNELGGGEDGFLYSFLKKKEKTEASSEDSNMPTELGEEPTEITPSESPSIGELKLANWDEITNVDFYGDPLAANRYNQILKEEYGDEAMQTQMLENASKMNNGIKNKIAEHKEAYPINFEERAYRIGGIDIKKSQTKQDLERLDKELNEQFNPDGFKSWSRDIRRSIVAGYEDEVISNLNSYLEHEGADMYKAAVTNPEYLNNWRKYAKKHVFGEMLDPAIEYIREAVDNAVLDNEYTYHTSKKIEEYKTRYNISEIDAAKRVEMEKVAAQRKHLEANMNKKELKRYEIQKKIDLLESQQVNGNKSHEIYQLNLQLEGDEMLYDADGKRLVIPENEEVANEIILVNNQIDEYKKEKNFKERLSDVHNDNWNIYQNLLRVRDEVKKEYNLIDKLASSQAVGREKIELQKAKNKLDHINSLLRDAKIKVDATGQMLFANQNIAKERTRFAMGQEIVETFVNTMPALFPPGTKNRSTPFQKTEAFVESMAEMGYPLSDEELDEINWEGAEWARAGGHLGSIALKLVAFNKVAGAVGVTKAVEALGSSARLKSAAFISKGGKVGRFAAPALGKLTEHAILGSMEGVAFQVVDGSFSTGALFYGANQAFNLPGELLSGNKSNMLGAIMKKNKKLALLLKAIVRGSASMTTGMEAVATTQAVIDGWINDKLISTELENMWGAESDWDKRVIMNLALSTMMGAPTYGKMARTALMPKLNERAVDLQQRLFRQGQIELGIEVGNVRGGIIDANLQKMTADAFNKKYEYLVNKQGVEPKELVDANGRYRLDIINQKFNEIVGDNINLYNEILGKGSAETALAKKRVLEKLGLPVEKMTLGGIEAEHYKYMHDPEISKKWSRKVKKESAKEDRRIRTEKYNNIESKLDKGLKENSVDDGISENTDIVEKISKNKRPDRSEIESQVIISNKKVIKDKSNSKLDKLSKDYEVKSESKNWESVKGYVKKALESVKSVIEVMKMIEMDAKKIDGMQKIHDDLVKSINTEKLIDPKKFRRITNKIIDQKKAFSSKGLETSINNQIESFRNSNAPHKHKLIADAIDVMFNRTKLQNELNNPKTKKSRAEKIEAQLAEYSKTEDLVNRIVGNKLNKREALELIEESNSKEFEAISKEIDKSIENYEVYEGIAEAFANSKNRTDLRNRKAEIRSEAINRKLSEAELIEYEMLSLFDSSTMTQNQLANAFRSVSRIILEGKSVHASEQRSKKIQKQVLEGEFIRDVYNKAFDTETLAVDAASVKEINALMRAYKSARMYIESFTTMMGHMMSNKVGRDIGTGTGYALVDGLIKANSGEQAAVSTFMNESLILMRDVFGSTSNAQAAFKKAGMGKRNPKKYDFDLVPGMKAESMTIPEAMTLYAYMRQPDQIARLEKVNKYQILKDGKLEGHSIESIKRQIAERGGIELVNWVEAVTETLLPKVWNVVNEQYKKDNGVDLEFIERYFPIFRYREGAGDAVVLGDPNNPMPSDYLPSTNKTNLKDRTGGNDYKLKDFNDVMFDYINRSMHYVHYQDIISTMNSLFKSEKVHDIIHKRFTNTANKSIKTLIEDLAAGETQSGAKIEWLDKSRRAFARAKLGFNPTLLPKQMVSISAFMSEMSTAEASKFVSRIPKWATVEILMEMPELINRYRLNEFNRDISERTRQTDMLAEKDVDGISLSKGKGLEWFKIKNLRDNQLIATKWGDLAANLYGGAKMYEVRYEALRNDGWSHAEASAKAKFAVIKAIEKTQQSGAIHNLSMLQRHGSYGKLISLFQNTPLQYLRIELAALDNMKEALTNARKGGVDMSKLSSATKTFMIYHFILPQLFRAATQGFYLGEDKSFMDDTNMFTGLLAGSLQYAPIVGTSMLSLLSHMNKGYSFGISQNILSDMLEDTDGLLELASDMIMKSNDPIGLTIDRDDILHAVNAATQWKGIPSASLGTWGVGIADYIQGKTDNPLALAGYSKTVYQGERLSSNIDDIVMFLPENGGNLNLFLEWMRYDLGDGKFQKQESVLTKEYMIYSKYGLDNSHVNYLYQGTENSHEQSNYLMSLFKAEVMEKKTIRPNYTLRQLRNDLEKGAVYTYPEFMKFAEDLLKSGVISEKAYDDFYLQLTLDPETYKEIFDFL